MYGRGNGTRPLRIMPHTRILGKPARRVGVRLAASLLRSDPDKRGTKVPGCTRGPARELPHLQASKPGAAPPEPGTTCRYRAAETRFWRVFVREECDLHRCLDSLCRQLSGARLCERRCFQMILTMISRRARTLNARGRPLSSGFVLRPPAGVTPMPPALATRLRGTPHIFSMLDHGGTRDAHCRSERSTIR